MSQDRQITWRRTLLDASHLYIFLAPSPGANLDGVNWDMNMHRKTSLRANMTKYGQSKAMNVMQAHEIALRYGSDGLISLSLHPGALKTNLQGHAPGLYNAIFSFLRYHQRYGGLMEVYAGLYKSVDTTMLEDGGENGWYILPWGRFGDGAHHVFEGLAKRKTGERLWDTCRE